MIGVKATSFCFAGINLRLHQRNKVSSVKFIFLHYKKSNQDQQIVAGVVMHLFDILQYTISIYKNAKVVFGAWSVMYDK